jgi:hypothetical protein
MCLVLLENTVVRCVMRKEEERDVEGVLYLENGASEGMR